MLSTGNATKLLPEKRTRMAENIERDELIRIVDDASTGITASTREKLFAVAETAEAVAVGWFHCDGVKCPASQAHRRNQAFQTKFDEAMAARFGREWDHEAMHPFEPFVVSVASPSTQPNPKENR